MNKSRIYEFRYNVPAENNILGKPDLFIEATAEWNKGTYHENGLPIIYNEGPVLSKLTRQQLFIVKDWHDVFRGIERIAQDYFLDQYTVQQPMNVVQIAEEVLQ